MTETIYFVCFCANAGRTKYISRWDERARALTFASNVNSAPERPYLNRFASPSGHRRRKQHFFCFCFFFPYKIQLISKYYWHVLCVVNTFGYIWNSFFGLILFVLCFDSEHLFGTVFEQAPSMSALFVHRSPTLPPTDLLAVDRLQICGRQCRWSMSRPIVPRLQLSALLFYSHSDSLAVHFVTIKRTQDISDWNSVKRTISNSNLRISATNKSRSFSLWIKRWRNSTAWINIFFCRWVDRTTVRKIYSFVDHMHINIVFVRLDVRFFFLNWFCCCYYCYASLCSLRRLRKFGLLRAERHAIPISVCSSAEHFSSATECEAGIFVVVFFRSWNSSGGCPASIWQARPALGRRCKQKTKCNCSVMCLSGRLSSQSMPRIAPVTMI